MDAPQGLIWVGAQRPEVGVLAVGGHQDVVQGRRVPHLHDDGGVAERVVSKPERVKKL